jgi:hypothetical protein
MPSTSSSVTSATVSTRSGPKPKVSQPLRIRVRDASSERIYAAVVESPSCPVNVSTKRIPAASTGLYPTHWRFFVDRRHTHCRPSFVDRQGTLSRQRSLPDHRRNGCLSYRSSPFARQPFPAGTPSSNAINRRRLHHSPSLARRCDSSLTLTEHLVSSKPPQPRLLAGCVRMRTHTDFPTGCGCASRRMRQVDSSIAHHCNILRQILDLEVKGFATYYPTAEGKEQADLNDRSALSGSVVSPVRNQFWIPCTPM